MQHPYTAKVTHQAKTGRWPSMRGQIFEKDMLIGSFVRRPMTESFVPPIEYKFYSEGSRNRFCSFADSLSIEETIEALIEKK